MLISGRGITGITFGHQTGGPITGWSYKWDFIALQLRMLLKRHTNEGSGSLPYDTRQNDSRLVCMSKPLITVTTAILKLFENLFYLC